MCQQECQEQAGYLPPIFRVAIGLAPECTNTFVSWWMFSVVSCSLKTGLNPETQIFLVSTPSLTHCDETTNTPGGKTLISALKAAAMKQTGASTVPGGRAEVRSALDRMALAGTLLWFRTVLYNFWPNF